MSDHPRIIFVCEHGAAKSIIAAAYFNKFAAEMGLAVQAIARGTNPDHELSANTIAGLRKDSLTPTESVPQKLLMENVKSATQIISFCELPEGYDKKGVEQWDNVPPVSENYETARDAIVERINQLINNIA